MKKHVIFGVLLGTLFVSSAAFAQTSKTQPAGNIAETMVFPDDKLLTNNLSAGVEKIGSRGGIVRTILVRPRTTFVPSMLRSIENL